VEQQGWTGSDPQPGGPRRVGVLSVHTSPLEQPGTGDSGGMNVTIDSLSRRLVARGVEVDVFTRATGPDLPPTVVVEDGLRVHHVEAGPAQLSKADLASHLCAFYLGLAAHPRVTHLDLLHGHYWMSGWVGRHAARRLGFPLVQTFHTLGQQKNATLAPGDQPEPALRLAAEQRLVADADAIIAPTAAEQALLRDRHGAAPGAVHVVPLGVDLSVFNTDGDRHATRQALGGGRIVLFAGRLQPLKGPDVAVRALAALDRRLPDDGVPTRLVIVGGVSGAGQGLAANGHGVDPAGLRALARDLGVEDRVALLSARRQSELALLYQAADVVVMPSRSESFGLVALEAQACGTPVVAANVDGLRSAVGRGAGTLVDGYEPEDWAAAIAPYLTDATLRAAVGARGRRHAMDYSWDRTAAGTLDVYAQVLARRSAAAMPARVRGA
jgi:D-inositol-3-phosphate glycosyltransferase